MLRTFSLVMLDNRDKIIDRFNLDIVTQPQGLGFAIELNTIITDIEEIPIHIKQRLQPITFNIHFAFGNEYQKAKALRFWIQKNTNGRMAIEWITKSGRVYADGKVESFEFTGLTPQNVISIPLKFRLLSPFFEIVENAISIFPSSAGKTYPYEYSYTYGFGVIENNEIINDYIAPIPLIITLYGEMTTPSVIISDKETGEAYMRVNFNGLTLRGKRIEDNIEYDADFLVINAITRKITMFNSFTKTELDAFNYVDPLFQTYIFARENIVSELDANIQSEKSGYMEASFRKYML